DNGRAGSSGLSPKHLAYGLRASARTPPQPSTPSQRKREADETRSAPNPHPPLSGEDRRRSRQVGQGRATHMPHPPPSAAPSPERGGTGNGSDVTSARARAMHRPSSNRPAPGGRSGRDRMADPAPET